MTIDAERYNRDKIKEVDDHNRRLLRSINQRIEEKRQEKIERILYQRRLVSIPAEAWERIFGNKNNKF